MQPLVTRSEPSRTTWYSDARRWRTVGVEVAITAVAMVVYFLLRGIRPDDIDTSVQRSLQIVQVEQSLGVFLEVHWQQFFLEHASLVTVANFIYAWLHYPVMLAIGLWLVVKDPVRFRFVRNVLLVSAVIGIVVYWFIPAAPPRLMRPYGYDFGFVDTVHGAASNVYYFQPGPFVNNFAALPSFHFGWIMLASAAVWVNTSSRLVRAGAVAMSLVMWWAVVVTGNHFFYDMVFGGVVVGFAWAAVALMQQEPVRLWLRLAFQQATAPLRRI